MRFKLRFAVMICEMQHEQLSAHWHSHKMPAVRLVLSAPGLSGMAHQMQGMRMSRAVIAIRSKIDRERAAKWSMQAPAGTRIEFKATKRSLPQNDRMWAMLTEVAVQLPWHGIKLSPDDWKLIFMDALKRELRMVPNIDGSGFVNLGRSSSDLSKAEMADLITLIEAFGANHGIVFRDLEPVA